MKPIRFYTRKYVITERIAIVNASSEETAKFTCECGGGIELSHAVETTISISDEGTPEENASVQNATIIKDGKYLLKKFLNNNY